MNNQCVPSWDLDNNNNLTFAHEIHNRFILENYDVAELTWKKGHVDMHGFDQPRAVPVNPFPSAATGYTWEKTGASGTLESIVDRAIIVPKIKLPTINLNDDKEKFVSLFDHHRNTDDSTCGGGDSGRDALVPSSNESCNDHTIPVSSSYSGTREWSRRDSLDVTVDTWDTYLDVNSASEEPRGSTSYDISSCNDITTTDDQYDSVCRSRRQEDKKKGSRRYSVSNKRSRAAATHNQSERKRRDKINQRMKTLQKMVPKFNKTDKASILDEVIEYLKQLEAQSKMMKMNMSPMNLPMMMLQKQLQMSMMMASMGIGMHNNINGILPLFYPTPYMPMSSWGGSGDRLAVPMIDPLSAFAACQSQPIMEAYSRMAALFQ